MKKRTRISLSLLLVIIIVLLTFYVVPLCGQKDISIEENRTLQHVPKFTINGFLKTEYQTELENSISDQLILSSQIKYAVKQMENACTSVIGHVFTANTHSEIQKENGSTIEGTPQKKEDVPSMKYNYTEVAKGIYKLDDSGYIIHKYIPCDRFNFDMYDQDMLNRVTYPKYLYFINTSVSQDFNNINDDAFEYIKTQFKMTDYAELKFKSFDEYKHYFYQTDHHWNYCGSYIGYTQIMHMMEGGNVKLLMPTGTVTYDTIYNGSLARDNLLKCSTEKFTVYTFNVPPYTTYVNDVQKTYGFRDLYVSKNEYPHKMYSNHYGMYYGDDHAKVVYKFNNPNAESILLLSTSFSNAVNELIASHYKETHVLDFRYYRKTYGERIDAQKYMEKNHLTKLLIIGDLPSLGYVREE